MFTRRSKHLMRSAFVFGLLLSVLAIGAIRFVAVKSDAVHYHADFALYINGVRDEFKGPGYYEEVQTCTMSDKDNPRARVHMHNEENSIVHVHDHAVTWGEFFANLGYTLGDKVLVTNDGVFGGKGGSKLSFVLNGQPVAVVANRVIGNEDVLLINYGDQNSAALRREYETIPRKAHDENLEKDPASCGGASPYLTLSDRLKKAARFWE